MIAKFQIGDEVEFKLYSKVLVGVIKDYVRNKGYEIVTKKRDVSLRPITFTVFVRESQIIQKTKVVVDEQR